MAVDPKEWLGEIRKLVKSGEVSLKSFGTADIVPHSERIGREARLFAAATIDALLPNLPGVKALGEDEYRSLSQSYLDAFEGLVRRLVITGDRAQKRGLIDDDLVSMDTKAVGDICNEFWTDMLALSSRLGEPPSKTAIKLTPVFHMTAADFDDVRREYPDFPLIDLRFLATRKQASFKKGVGDAIEAIELISRTMPSIPASYVRRFALEQSDPVGTAMTAFAIEIPSLMRDFPELSKADATHLAIAYTDKAAGAAQTAIDASIALQTTVPEISAFKALALAVRSPKQVMSVINGDATCPDAWIKTPDPRAQLVNIPRRADGSRNRDGAVTTDGTSDSPAPVESVVPESNAVTWLSELRKLIRDGEVSTGRPMAMTQERARAIASRATEVIRESSADDLLRVLPGLSEFGDAEFAERRDIYLQVFERRVEHAVVAGERALVKGLIDVDLIGMDGDELAATCKELWFQFCTMSARFGSPPAISDIEDLPVLRTTAQDIDALANRRPDLKPDQLRYLILHNPDEYEKIADRFADALIEIEKIAPEISSRDATIFALYRQDPITAVREAQEAVANLKSDFPMFTNGMAMTILLSNNNGRDLTEAAKNSLKMSDQLRALYPEVTEKAALFASVKSPKWVAAVLTGHEPPSIHWFPEPIQRESSNVVHLDSVRHSRTADSRDADAGTPDRPVDQRGQDAGAVSAAPARRVAMRSAPRRRAVHLRTTGSSAASTSQGDSAPSLLATPGDADMPETSRIADELLDERTAINTRSIATELVQPDQAGQEHGMDSPAM